MNYKKFLLLKKNEIRADKVELEIPDVKGKVVHTRLFFVTLYNRS